LILEGVPPTDSKFRELVRGRDAIYTHITETAFREADAGYFTTVNELALANGRLMPSIESNQLLLAAAAACEDKKAEDIRILALDPSESGLTDYFLICNGTN